MKKLILLLLLFTCSKITQAQSIGDFVFISYSNDAPDAFSILVINDIAPSTIINFTDNAWTGSALAGTENTAVWTTPITTIPAGTIITFTNSSGTTTSVSPSGNGTVTSALSGLSSDGDNIFAYTGLSSSPNFIAALATRAWITTGSTASTTSYLPSVFTEGVNAISFSTEVDNGFYNNTVTGTKQALIALSQNSTNWTRSNTLQSLPSWSPSISTNTTISANASVSNLTVAANQTLSLSTFTLTVAGLLTIESNINGSGSIGNSTGSISGNVIVERYIPAKSARKWTFLSSPVGGVKLNSADGWQQQMHITGAGTGGTNCVDALSGNQPTQHTNGFDATLAAQNSFFYYDPAAGAGLKWTPISATNGTTATSGTLQVGMGYRANIRGTRAQGCAILNAANPPAPDAVTLSTKGTITTGDVSVTLPTGFSLVGNPYPATIDWNNATWQSLRTTNNVANTYYTYSPANASSVYTTYNGTIITNAGGLTNGNLIASGQAFFVERTSGSGAISNFFQEGFKSLSTQNGVFRTNQPNQIQSQIRVGLKKAVDTAHIDEVVIAFSNDAAINKNFNSQFDSKTINDAPQMIASIKETTQAAIQKRPINNTNDTVHLFVKSTTNASLYLQFTEHTNMPGEIILRDKFLNATQDIKANAFYNFNVTTDPLSQGGERFELVFRSASTLPVQFVTVNAEKKAVGAQVNFTIAKDEEAKNYMVERSNGNANFTAFATIDSKNQTGNVSYTALDNQAIQGTVLYRVKANSKNGGYVYSPTVKLAGDKGAVQLTLYPNPVKETLNIQTEGTVAGKVCIRIVNQLGEVMQTLNNMVISNSQVSMNVAKLPAGVYHVSISNGADYTAKGSFVK